jgi:hypothetical protein
LPAEKKASTARRVWFTLVIVQELLEFKMMKYQIPG